MRRTVTIVTLVVMLGVVGVFIFNRHQTANNSSTRSNMNMSGSSSTNSTTTSIATNAVTIRNFVFSPASITIKKDTKVLWTNQDSVAHTVTETGSQAGPNSSALDPGTSYSFTFVQAGSYHYHCSIHPQMTGTVTVTD